jgi:hypothetical protein
MYYRSPSNCMCASPCGCNGAKKQLGKERSAERSLLHPAKQISSHNFMYGEECAVVVSKAVYEQTVSDAWVVGIQVAYLCRTRDLFGLDLEAALVDF